MIALWWGWAWAGEGWREAADAAVAACSANPAPCEAAEGLELTRTRAGFLVSLDERALDPAVAGPLLGRLLAERDPAIRRGLADAVVDAVGGQPGSPWEAAWIELAAADPQEEVRAVLVSGMRRAPWSVAGPGLRGALASASAATRAEAVATMGGHPEGRRFVADLAGALADPDPEVRRLSARALRWLADPSARGALQARLGDPDPSVRAEVARALDALP